jgi:hypothetical protein
MAANATPIIEPPWDHDRREARAQVANLGVVDSVGDLVERQQRHAVGAARTQAITGAGDHGGVP